MKTLRNQSGFISIEYLIIFSLIFPFFILMGDFVQWGGKWLNAQVCINDTAQKMGEHGGLLDGTIPYLQQRFADAGLDPAEWDLTISAGPLAKGEEGVIAVSSTYTFKSLKIVGITAQVPLRASATFTSQIWMR
jgi:hypothetical protein